MSIAIHPVVDGATWRRLALGVLVVLLFATAVFLGLRGAVPATTHTEQQAPAATAPRSS